MFTQSGHVHLTVNTAEYWWSVAELKHGGFYSGGFLCYLAIDHHSFYVGRNVLLDLILLFHLLFVSRNLTKKQNLDQREPCLAYQHYIQSIQKYFA